jgi:hypothetical protein
MRYVELYRHLLGLESPWTVRLTSLFEPALGLADTPPAVSRRAPGVMAAQGTASRLSPPGQEPIEVIGEALSIPLGERRRPTDELARRT